MTFPSCFENQRQYDDWIDADINCYHKSAISLHCTDCTPAYAAEMRKQGRCEHPEVKFYKFKNAFIGRTKEPPKAGAREKQEILEWEPIDAEAISNGTQPETDEGAGIPVLHS